jgi:hypothetical protein
MDEVKNIVKIYIEYHCSKKPHLMNLSSRTVLKQSMLIMNLPIVSFGQVLVIEQTLET